MEPNELLKKIDLLSEELRSEYVEKLNSIIKDVFYQEDSKNKESLQMIDESIQFHVNKFEEELQSILKEALEGLEKRKSYTNEKVESSEKTLRERFSEVFESVYSKLKSFLN